MLISLLFLRSFLPLVTFIVDELRIRNVSVYRSYIVVITLMDCVIPTALSSNKNYFARNQLHERRARVKNKPYE